MEPSRPVPSATRPRWTAVLLAVVAIGLLLGACGGSTSADDRPRIVVTTTILGDLVQRVVGDAARVEVLMPPGTDPHDFEPSAAQAARLREASLIVESGLDLEQRLQPAIDAAGREGVPVLSLGEMLEPRPLADDPEVLDPHWWLDPERMARAATIVAGESTRAIAADASTTATFRANAQRYADDALAAARDAASLLAAVPEDLRVLITNHDALGYFADRFGLRIEGVVVPGGSSLAEPSAADIARLVGVLRDSGVRAIFSESTTSSKLPSSIARAAGGDVRVIGITTDTLGKPGTGTDTYPGLIVELARRIADGLGSP